MTDEERQRTMDFIIAQQAQFSVDIQKLKESTQELSELQKNATLKTNRHDHQLDRLERILKLVIKAGVRERKRLREEDKRLRESQAHSDKRLDALIDIIREQRNGKS
jgi:hypothetical protein